MEVKFLDKNKEKIRFLVEGITPALAGELRRIMISELPTLAIEWIDFHKNDSVLWDEIIANRLGLVPLVFDQKFYNFKDSCKCDGKGCTHCQVTLALKRKGPCMIYSGDLVSSDKNVKPVYDKIPIVELLDEGELELEAIAEMGLGKDHTKWQGAVVGFQNVPNITISNNLTNAKECVDKCPRNVFSLKDKKLKVSNSLKCNLCLQCVETCKPEGTIKVEPDETKFIFNVESACGLNPNDIVMGSIDILSDKLKEFTKGIGKLK